MAVLGSVIFDISANTAKIEKSLTKVNKRFGRMEKNTKKLAATMKTALIGAFAAIGAQRLFVGALKETIEFEKEMINVATLLDTTKVSMVSFNRQILSLTTEVNRSAADLARGLFQVVSAGIAAEEAMGVLEVAAKAATAGVTSTETAVLALTKSMAIYGIESADAMKVSDLLFKTVEKGQTTFEQLALQIGRILPFARAMGISMEEALATFAGMTTILGTTEQAATALEATFRAFVQNADKFKAAGIDINESLSEKGLIGTLKLLDEKTGGSAQALKKMGIETEALRGVLGLFGGKLEDVEKNLLDFKDATGTTLTAFEKQMDSTEEKIKAFSIAWSQLKISMSDKALPLITRGLDKLAGKLRFLNTQLGKRETDILQGNIDKIRDRLERLNREREGLVGKIVGKFLPTFFIDQIKEATEELGRLEAKRAKILSERFSHTGIVAGGAGTVTDALAKKAALAEALRAEQTKKATEALKKQITAEQELAKQFADTRDIIIESLSKEVSGRKEQIQGLEDFKDNLFDTYDQAIEKVNKFQEVQKSASEVRVSAIKGLEDIFDPEKSPFKKMEQSQKEIIKGLKEGLESTDVNVIDEALKKTLEFLQKFKGIKDTFGFEESFFKVRSLYEDLTDRLGVIARQALSAGEAWGAYADEQAAKIELVDQWIMRVQQDIDELNAQLDRVNVLDIDTSPARTKLEELSFILEGMRTSMIDMSALFQNLSTQAEVAREKAILKGGSEFTTNLTDFHSEPNLPEFATGTQNVPKDMIAKIHAGETIVPAGQKAGGDVYNFNITGKDPEAIAREIDRIMTARSKNHRSEFSRELTRK